MDGFPDEILEHHEREIDEGQRLTRGLGQLELLRTRDRPAPSPAGPRRRPHWFTTAFFHHPEELRAEVADAGLEVLELVGVEGLAGSLPQLDRRWQDPRDRS